MLTAPLPFHTGVCSVQPYPVRELRYAGIQWIDKGRSVLIHTVSVDLYICKCGVPQSELYGGIGPCLSPGRLLQFLFG